MPRINPKAEPFNEKVREWREAHPDFMECEAVQTIKPRVSEDKIKKLKNILPRFCAFIDLLPDQIISLRKEHIETQNDFFEKKIGEYKIFLVSLDYSKQSVNSELGVIASLFSNYSKRLTLDLPKIFWKLTESKTRKAQRTRKNPPDNDEVRAICKVTDRRARIAILLGYQAGLAPTDIVKLTWANLSLDFTELEKKPQFERFSYVRHQRNKTEEEGLIIINPDLYAAIHAEWLDQGKPNDPSPILSYRGSEIQPRHCNEWFKECVEKALGADRAGGLTFYNLRDSFNNVIKTTPELKQEIADRLMGHSIEGSRGNYFLTPDYILEVYKEKIFHRLTINGWKYEKQSALEFGDVMERVDAKIADYVVVVNKLQQQLDDQKIESEQQKNKIEQMSQRNTELRRDSLKVHKQNLNLIQFLVSRGILTTAEAKELRDAE